MAVSAELGGGTNLDFLVSVLDDLESIIPRVFGTHFDLFYSRKFLAVSFDRAHFFKFTQADCVSVACVWTLTG